MKKSVKLNGIHTEITNDLIYLYCKKYSLEIGHTINHEEWDNIKVEYFTEIRHKKLFLGFDVELINTHTNEMSDFFVHRKAIERYILPVQRENHLNELL